jgi:hypothetical protein
MKTAASIKISGIKCDNPSCDYTNEEVALDEYENWLNKPCPCCGENLLTEDDFNTVKLMVAMVQIANEAPQAANNIDEPMIEAKISMDGSGSINVDEMKIKD